MSVVWLVNTASIFLIFLTDTTQVPMEYETQES